MQTGSVTASGNLADRWSVISAAIILWTFGALFFAALPIYLGGAADAFGLSAREIGFLGSSYLAGFVVAGVVAVAWLPRVNWRVGTASGGAVAIGACAVSVTAANYNVLLLLLFVLGCGKGTVYAVCFRILGAATDPGSHFRHREYPSDHLAGRMCLCIFDLGDALLGFYGVHAGDRRGAGGDAWECSTAAPKSSRHG